MQYEQAFASFSKPGKSSEEALERLNKVLEYDPRSAMPMRSRAMCCWKCCRTLTTRCLRRSWRCSMPRRTRILSIRSRLIYEKRGQYAEAERAMREALVVNPNYVDVYFSLGILYADEMKDPVKSVEGVHAATSNLGEPCPCPGCCCTVNTHEAIAGC